MTESTRIPGLRGEFLWELDIVTRQSLGLADAFPAEKYDWRPDPKARSVSEVFVHVAAGNFVLLDIVGGRAPEDLFGAVPPEGPDRFKELIQGNDELIAQVREKSAVAAWLRRSLVAVNDAITRTCDDELGRGLFFIPRTDHGSPRLPAPAGPQPQTHGPDDCLPARQWKRNPVAGLAPRPPSKRRNSKNLTPKTPGPSPKP
jgi:hypothetical protein